MGILWAHMGTIGRIVLSTSLWVLKKLTSNAYEANNMFAPTTIPDQQLTIHNFGGSTILLTLPQYGIGLLLY